MSGTAHLVDVTVRYRRSIALDRVTADFRPGVTGLLGPNGAGKTTLLSVLATALEPAMGTVTVDGHDVRSAAGRQRARRQIGWLPQRFDLAGGMTLQDTVCYAGWCHGVDAGAVDRAAQEALAMVGLIDRANDRVRRLSGGQRQRLGLAAALAHEPTVLLLDEPTAGLDPEQRLRFLAGVRGAAGRRTVVVSTHLLDDVDRTCDRVCVLADGAVKFNGAVRGLSGRAAGSGSARDALEDNYLRLLDDGDSC